VNGSPPAVGSRGGIRLRTAAVLLTALMTLSLALAARADALIYFPNNDRILRAALNGAGAHPFISGADHPCGLAANSTHIFWVNRGNPNAVTTSHIGRARLDGTQVNQQFIPNVGTEACGVAVNGTHIFWGTGTETSVGRANLSGTGKDVTFIGGQGSDICGVAVNSTYIFAALNTAGTIRRYPLGGGGATTLGGASIPCGVAANATHIYWANRGSGYIGRAQENLLMANNSFIDTDFGSPCGPAVNGTHVFWTDSVGVGRANLDGSGVNLEFVKDPLAVPGTPSTYTDCGVAVDSLPVPANTFKLGKVKLNKKKGIAILTVPTSWPGRVTAAGKGVRKVSRRAGVGRVKLRIRAKGRKLRRLNRAGRVRVRVKVTHRPAGGKATSKRKRIRLVKKR
jgi:hypothetical protein